MESGGRSAAFTPLRFSKLRRLGIFADLDTIER